LSIRVELERTRELIFAYGWNTTCFQIVNPGIERWFTMAGDAVIGFVAKHKIRVVAGAPVCKSECLSEVVQEFEQAGRVCFFGAEQRLRTAAKCGKQLAKNLINRENG
jgi:hypothetical protein